MGVALYMDAHVPYAISDQLRRRGVDVLTAQDDGYDESPDDELLERAHKLQRVVFTQDILFRAMAEDWQQAGQEFHGLLFGRQIGVTIGQYVIDLELIGKASELGEWINVVAFVPFPRRS